MNLPIEVIGKDGKPVDHSPDDQHNQPPATTTTENPFEGMTVEEVFERMRWDGSIGPKPVRPNGAERAKKALKRRNKQRAAKAARKRNRK